MAQFGSDTKGTEIVAAFPEKVKNKICMSVHLRLL